MAGIIEKTALEIADAVAENTEFVVVGAEYKKEGQDKYLRIYIDKTGGVGINECEEFSKAFDESFDKLELIDEAYILEVSSPGVDRILKTQREFDYYTGREVDVKLYKAIDGKKEFTGSLKTSGDTLVIETETGEISFPKETVSKAYLCDFYND